MHEPLGDVALPAPGRDDLVLEGQTGSLSPFGHLDPGIGRDPEALAPAHSAVISGEPLLSVGKLLPADLVEEVTRPETL